MTGVFLFLKENLAENSSPAGLLELQILDLVSKRDNFEVVEEERTESLAEKTITSVVYSGEKDSSCYYYRFALIEFADHPDLIPIVLQTVLPSEWNQRKSALEELTRSARVRSSDTGQ